MSGIATFSGGEGADLFIIDYATAHGSDVDARGNGGGWIDVIDLHGVTGGSGAGRLEPELLDRVSW